MIYFYVANWFILFLDIETGVSLCTPLNKTRAGRLCENVREFKKQTLLFSATLQHHRIKPQIQDFCGTTTDSVL